MAPIEGKTGLPTPLGWLKPPSPVNEGTHIPEVENHRNNIVQYDTRRPDLMSPLVNVWTRKARCNALRGSYLQLKMLPLLQALKLAFLLLWATTRAQEPGNPFTWDGASYDCKCVQTDACWPADSVWNSLNTTVGGNLHKVVPDAAVCHNTFEGQPTYDAAACEDVTNNFGLQPWQYVVRLLHHLCVNVSDLDPLYQERQSCF
jgi:hypothetical protein